MFELPGVNCTLKYRSVDRYILSKLPIYNYSSITIIAHYSLRYHIYYHEEHYILYHSLLRSTGHNFIYLLKFEDFIYYRHLLSGETQTLVSANFCCCLRPDLLLSRMFSYKAQQVVKLRITSYCPSSQCFIFSLENQRGNKFINDLPDFLAVVYGQATCY